MAEFIPETNYSSRRIIRETDNSSKFKFEDEFFKEAAALPDAIFK